jgi:hypothetical protein
MSKNISIKSDFPVRPPSILLIIAAFFLILAVFVSSESLSAIGIMYKSLNSSDPMVRNTAIQTVKIFKIFCFMSFGATIILIISWKIFLRLEFVKRVMEHNPIKNFENLQIDSIVNIHFLIILSIVIIGIVFVAMSNGLINKSLIIFVSKEDGLIEQATALIFLICSFLSAFVAMKTSVRSRKIIHTLFATGFFLCFGEEISWGQRIFGFETPEIISEANVQNEFNLHNLGGYLFDHLFILGVFTYGFVFPALTWMHEFWLKLMDKLGLPIASPGLAVGFLLTSMIHDWTVYRVLPVTLVSIGELRELLSSICFLLLMIESRQLLLKGKVAVGG